jgi:hypothetical protein
MMAFGLIVIAPGCDSADMRTTGTVTDLPAGRLCFLPEDPDQTDLEGCFPLSAEDAARVQVGDCISVIVPNQLDPEKRDDPLRSIGVLDRICRRP